MMNENNGRFRRAETPKGIETCMRYIYFILLIEFRRAETPKGIETVPLYLSSFLRTV